MIIKFFLESEKFFDYLSNRVIFCFFSPDLFMKTSNFSKTARKILHSHFTPKGAPVCSKASKWYDWNVRNIAKISPKMAKSSPKTAIFRLFSIFSKTVNTIRTKFLQSFYPILGSFMCIFIKFVWLGREKQSQN